MTFQSMDYVMEYAPSLRDQWITLQPFVDVINSVSAGPQPQSTRYDGSEKPHLMLDFSTWRNGECIDMYVFKITADGVVLLTDGGERPSSMPLLWAYLRSLPRPVYSFTQQAFA